MVEIQGRHVSAELSSSGGVIQPSGQNHFPKKSDEAHETMFELLWVPLSSTKEVDDDERQDRHISQG